MPVTVDDLDQAVRSITTMRDEAVSNGVAGPYAVLLPKPILNALKRSGRPLPFDIALYPVMKTDSASKFPRGMHGRTCAGL